jgi:hypothetical protein
MEFLFVFYLLCWKDTVHDYVYVKTYKDLDVIIKEASGKDCKIEYYDIRD